MTPVELNLFAGAYAECRKDEQRLTQVNIYSLAALIRPMVWAKRAPSFENVFPNEGVNEEMTDEQMYAMVQGLNAIFGGEDEPDECN